MTAPRIAVLVAGPVALLALAAVPLASGPFGLQLGTLVVVYTLAVVGLDAVAGRGGLLHVGFGIMFGVGAYTVAVMSREWDGPVIIALVLGALLAGVASTVLGLILRRSSGYLFAVLTLAASTAVASIVNNVGWLGGTAGLGGVSRDLLGTGDIEPTALYVLICAITALVIGLYTRFRSSATGRAAEAARLVPGVALASGVNIPVLRVKLTMFAGIVGGIAGGFYAVLQQYVSADLAGTVTSVNLLAMNIIGGSGVGLAGLPGAVISVALPQWAQSLVSYQLIIVGSVMGIVALWLTRGVAGTLQDLWWCAVRPLFAERRLRELQGNVRPMAPAPRRAEPDEPLVRVEGVTVDFGGLVALRDVSLDLSRGVVHALVGPNGAGKSTLVGSIAGSVRPTSGRILLGGRDLASLRPEERAASGITRTFQLVSLCDTLTVLENAMLGGHAALAPSFTRDLFVLQSRKRERALAGRARAWLDQLGAGHLEDRRPTELTSGQQRLVEVARCLMTEAEVILLDEPAAGLSAGERNQLATVIRRLAAEGRAVLLIEHDLEFVMALAQRITVLADGMILSDGDPERVRADPLVVEAYWGRSVAA